LQKVVSVPIFPVQLRHRDLVSWKLKGCLMIL
jgi:hypothetical protein